MPTGTVLEFEGVAKSYVANPYSLTLVVDPKALVGWKGQ
jgi:hypothetical protein